MARTDIFDRPQLVVDRRPSADPATVIAVAGEVDADNCAHLHQQVTALLPCGPAGRVALDLSELTFIGSAGVRTLLQCRHQAEQRGLRLTVSEAHDNVRTVVGICGFDDLFDVS
jgi:anti-anti-sigma factor